MIDDDKDLSIRPASQPNDHVREPIFNRMPLGVVLVSAAIWLVYLLPVLFGPSLGLQLERDFGLSVLRMNDSLRNGDFFDVTSQLITYQFLHGGLVHLAMNFALLLQAGPIAEAGLARRGFAPVRFILFYLTCGTIGGLVTYFASMGSNTTIVGASCSISGVFGGFLWAALGLARPEQSMLKPVVYSGAVFLLINVGLAWVARATGLVPIAWEGHLGGFVAGLVLYPAFVRLGVTMHHPRE